MLKQVQKLSMLVLLWISFPVFLLLTNPETIPLPLLIVPFLLLLAALYMTSLLLLRVGFGILTISKRKAIAAVLAVLPTLLLILASIRQLTVRDVAIVVGLLILLTFYMRRIDFLKI